SAVATLTVLQGPDKGRIFHFTAEAEEIGRGSKTVPLNDSSVSRRHAEVRRGDGTWVLGDLGAGNRGDGKKKRVGCAAALRSGDKIRMGGTLLIWAGDEPVIRAQQPAVGADLVNLDAAAREPDVSVVSTVASNDDSVILASPAAADAVRAWRVMAQLAD